MSDLTKDKVFWTKTMNLKLVKYIECRPHMWSPKHPEYTSVKKREKTYAKFASKYDNLLTPQAVKDRWTNIRCTFGHYLRKCRQKKVKGDVNYRVNWHLWEACQFLLKANRKQVTEIKNNTEQHENHEDNTDNSSEEYQNDTKVSSQCYEITENLVKVFKNVKNDEFMLDNSTNGQIGRLVAERLSQMNSYNAAVLSSKIMEVLLIYDSNNPSNPNNVDRLSMEHKLPEFESSINHSAYTD